MGRWRERAPADDLSENSRAEIERALCEIVEAAPFPVSTETVVNLTLDYALTRKFVLVNEGDDG